MSEIVRDFEYKSYPSSDQPQKFSPKLKGVNNHPVKKPDMRLKIGSKHNKSNEFELQIISNLIKSPGLYILWNKRRFLTVLDVCKARDSDGLPVILKAVCRSHINSEIILEKNDKLFIFGHGNETRRFCEEHETGRYYTVFCESRSLLDHKLENKRTADETSSIFYPSSDSHHLYANVDFLCHQDDDDSTVKDKRKACLQNLKARKHGVKYQSKFLVAAYIKDDILQPRPFLINEDLSILFKIAVGIEGCNEDQWLEYCNAHLRTSRQFKIQVILENIDDRVERLYLDQLEADIDGIDENSRDVANSKHKKSISIHLDNYVIGPSSGDGEAPDKSSSLPAKSSSHLSPHLNLQKLTKTASTGANKKTFPIMGTSLMNVLKASPETVKIDSINCNKNLQRETICGDSSEVEEPQGPYYLLQSNQRQSNEDTYQSVSSSPSFKSSTSPCHESYTQCKLETDSFILSDLSSSLPHDSTAFIPITMPASSTCRQMTTGHSKLISASSTIDEGYYTKSDAGAYF